MILLALLLGLCIGSFLNVVVWRLPRGESVVWPGSHCPRCASSPYVSIIHTTMLWMEM